MAVQKVTKKDGTTGFRISATAPDGSRPCTMWYPSPSWSAKVVERELRMQEAAFISAVKSGEVITKRQRKRDEEAEARAQAEQQAQIVTFAQFVESVYLPQRKIELAENTYSSLLSSLNIRFLPEFGELPIRELKPVQLQAFFNDLQKELKITSVQTLYNRLCPIFKYAAELEIIDTNPMLKVHRPREAQKTTNAEPESFSMEEISEILQALKDEKLKWQVWCELAIETGCRRGEITAIQWSDVDFEQRTVQITKSANFTKQAGVYIGPTKGRKNRVVFFSGETGQLMQALRSEQRKNGIATPWLFTQDGSGEMMHPQSPTRWFSRFGKRNGIVDFHPHKLRHSFASLSITSGADIVSVSEVLGHADPSITMKIYAHADEESKRAASNILHEAIRKNA